jgi:uncharacterized protein
MGHKYLWGLSTRLSLFNLNPKESPNELFGREKEIEEITRLIKAKRWVAVLGPRMVGKTSLLKATGAKLEKDKIRVIYANLWGAKGTNGLLKALARGLNEEKSILQKIKNIRIEGISIGPAGIGINVSKKPMTTVWDLLDAIGRQKEDCVIELDEVQELAAISGRLLKILANMFNTHPNMVFVFTGSMFGLMKTLLEPEATSPLYGRSPAKLYLQPFSEETAMRFLKKGFQECSQAMKDSTINEAVERLDGIPGWLTLYGNKVLVQKLKPEQALEETIDEASKIVKDELEHFLEGRDRQAYIAALKAVATTSRWTEIKGAIQIAKSTAANDGTVYKIIENLKAAMLISEEKGAYRVKDPMLKAVLLSSDVA